MDDPDIYFIHFFHSVLENELSQFASSVHRECLRGIHQRRRWCSGGVPPAARCASVYHLAPCLASAIYGHLDLLLTRNPFVSRRTVLRRHFAACCLASGLAVDFVPLVRWLDRTLRPPSCRDWIDVELTVVVEGGDWTSTLRAMADKLSEELLEDSSLLHLDLRFVAADFSGPLTDDVKGALRRSDLVTATQFVGGVPEVDRGNRLLFIKDVVHFMREGGILFFLDNPGFCDVLKETVDSCDEPLIQIYGPVPYSVQRMRMLSRKECIRLYSKHYGWRCCQLERAHSVCSWYKRRSEFL